MVKFLASTLLLSISVWSVSVQALLGGRASSTLSTSEGSLEALYPFYHTSQQIESALQELLPGCVNVAFHYETDGNASVPVLSAGSIGEEHAKVMLVFGEHPRELISSESAVAFAKELCAGGDDASAGGSSMSAQMRQNTSFILVANANPSGRRSAEQGSFCTRTNEDHVDLNRNYDFHWKHQSAGSKAEGIDGNAGKEYTEYDSGPRAFSEPETRIVRRLLEAYKPTAYVSVHSGAEAMLMPWAYRESTFEDAVDLDKMRHVLDRLQAENCKTCLAGAAADEIGYVANGVGTDFAYHEGTPFAFTFEIFKKNPDLSLVSLDDKHFLGHMRGPADDDRQESNSFAPQESNAWTPADCFAWFNPTTSEQYSWTLQRWNAIYLSLAAAVQQ